jgi:hypothetical protein
MGPNHVISIAALIVTSSLFCAASDPGAAGLRIINQSTTLKSSDNNGNSFLGAAVAISKP